MGGVNYLRIGDPVFMARRRFGAPAVAAPADVARPHAALRIVDDRNAAFGGTGTRLITFGSAADARAYAGSAGADVEGVALVTEQNAVQLQYRPPSPPVSDVAHEVVHAGAHAGTWTSDPFTPVAGALLVVLASAHATGGGAAPTVSDSLSGTWVNNVSSLHSDVYNSVWRQQQPGTPAPLTVTIDPGYQGWQGITIVQTLGHRSSVPIQVATTNSGAAGTTPRQTLFPQQDRSLLLFTGATSGVAPSFTGWDSPAYAPGTTLADHLLWSRAGGAPAPSTAAGWCGVRARPAANHRSGRHRACGSRRRPLDTDDRRGAAALGAPEAGADRPRPLRLSDYELSDRGSSGRS